MRLFALVVAVFVCARPAAAQSTFLYFTSQQGDYIGQGQNWVYTPADATFTATFDARNAVSIDVNPPSTCWWAAFAAPGDVPLAPGTYLNATRYPFNGPTVPGLSPSGDGRGCNTLTGHFTVLEVVYGPGNTVTRFAADFEQHCEGG